MSTPIQPAASDFPNPLPANLPPASRRRWWLKLLLAALIFASGMVVGGGVTLIAVRNRALAAIHHPEEAPARIAARLRSKLGLSDQQTRQVEAIVRTRQRSLAAIRREVQPRVVAELDHVEAEIAAVLDDAQRQKWHALFTHLRETWLPPLAK